MRDIPVGHITEALISCIEKASFHLDPGERDLLERARMTETSPTGRSILDQLLKNAGMAALDLRPLCQDTGVAVVYADIGQEVHLTGGSLDAAIQAGIREGYQRYFLRKSLVAHPLNRKNTGDNTPAIVHTRVVPGDRLRLDLMTKGGGCENMSRLAMLKPSEGRAGVVEFVVRTVAESGGNACPPLVVGVGIGGNFERCAKLAKRSLLRPFGEPAATPEDRDLEQELLARLNKLGNGPMGLGGDTTALEVRVRSEPCHIASLPVAVNLDCHSHRHASVVL